MECYFITSNNKDGGLVTLKLIYLFIVRKVLHSYFYYFNPFTTSQKEDHHTLFKPTNRLALLSW